MHKIIRFLTVITASALMISCTPVTARHGNLLEDYQLVELKPGVSTQSDVLRVLGSPTTQSTFNRNIWYYLGQDTEKRSVLDAEVTKERTVTISFNNEGVVTKIQDSGGQWKDINYAREQTPTHGNDLTFTQQLLGNMGRFNKITEGTE